MSETPTPKTDTAATRHCAERWLDTDEIVLADFARQLERDLAAMTAERDAFRSQCERQAHEANKWSKEYIVARAERDHAARMVDELCEQCGDRISNCPDSDTPNKCGSCPDCWRGWADQKARVK